MRKYSIRLVSTFIIAVLGILNILVFYFFTYQTASTTIENRYRNEAELMLQYTKTSLEEKFKTAEKALKRLSADNDLIAAAEQKEIDSLTKELQSYDEMIPGNDSIVMGLEDGTFIGSREFLMPESHDPRLRTWYTNGKTLQESITWSDPFLDYLNQDIVFSASRSFYAHDNRLIGVIAIVFKVATLSSNIAESKVGNEGFIMLMSNTGEVIANRDDYFIGKRIFDSEFFSILTADSGKISRMEIEDSKYIISSRSLNFNGMVIVTAIKESDIRNELRSVFSVIFIIEAVILFVFSFLIFLLTRKLIEPLLNLVKLMRKVEKGDYTVHANFAQFKEIAEISHGFNNMINGLYTRDEILKNREIKIKNLAYYDNLTGLPNRTLLIQSLEEKLTSNDFVDRSGALMYIDLDRFKIINDTMGHSVGDKVLVEVAKKIFHSLRYGQIAARLGGDEFVILLPGVNSVELIMKVADRLMKQLNKPVRIDEKEYDTHASIGVVFYPLHGDSVDVLLKKADMAMYKAKREGKNNYQIFEENLQSEILRKLNIKNGIREALDKSLFEVHYQPQYRVADSVLCGLEALLRGTSPALHGVPVQELISVAEETGQIIEIESFVLEESCRFARRLIDLGWTDIKISINVSPIHIMQRDFVPRVISFIDQFGVNKNMIELEITETIMLDAHESNLQKLEELNEHGIRIHMDDFGTGYSSLNYLQELPIHYVKIDKTFVHRIEKNSNKNKITALIIELSHNLGLEVIAEGVENQVQHQYLQECECDIIQGFFLSPPLPPDKIVTLPKQADL